MKNDTVQKITKLTDNTEDTSEDAEDAKDTPDTAEDTDEDNGRRINRNLLPKILQKTFLYPTVFLHTQV